MSGRFRSRTTTSGLRRATSSSPSDPSEAVCSVSSGSAKARRNACRMELSSSITRMVAMSVSGVIA